MYADRTRLRGRPAVTAATWLFTALAVGPIVAQSQERRVQIPESYRDADAVILEHDQRWEKDAGGEVKYRDRKLVLLQDPRAYRAFADPRITFNGDFQEIRILAARRVSPRLDVPDYGRNTVSPRGVGGWPAFSSIRQQVVSFSGIEAGGVYELHYERLTKPGMHAYLEAECRLNEAYPTLRRVIKFPGDAEPRVYENLDAAHSETGSLPWRNTCETLWYSDCPDEKTWAAGVLEGIEAAARRSAPTKETVDAWIESNGRDSDKPFDIQKNLMRRLNIVSAPNAWRGDKLRGAEEVLASNYASPPEAAAVLLLLFREAGLEARPFFTIASEKAGWIRAAISEFGVAVAEETGTSYWHAKEGRIPNPGPWGGARRYDSAYVKADPGTEPERFDLPQDNRLKVNARITIDPTAKWQGQVDIHATGLFINSTDLRSRKNKEKAIKAILNAVLPGNILSDFTIKSLSDSEIEVSARVASEAALEQVAGAYHFVTPAQAPWMSGFAFPLKRSKRKTDLRIAAPFKEHVAIDITVPQGWSVVGNAGTIEKQPANHARLHQRVSVDGTRISVDRKVEIDRRDISAKAFPPIRDAINRMVTRRSRTLVIKPVEKVADAVPE